MSSRQLPPCSGDGSVPSGGRHVSPGNVQQPSPPWCYDIRISPTRDSPFPYGDNRPLNRKGDVDVHYDGSALPTAYGSVIRFRRTKGPSRVRPRVRSRSSRPSRLPSRGTPQRRRRRAQSIEAVARALSTQQGGRVECLGAGQCRYCVKQGTPVLRIGANVAHACQGIVVPPPLGGTMSQVEDASTQGDDEQLEPPPKPPGPPGPPVPDTDDHDD